MTRGWEYRPIRPQRGSRLPLLVKAKLHKGPSLAVPAPTRGHYGGAVDCELLCPYGHHHQHPVPEVVVTSIQQELRSELVEMEDQWEDEYVQCGPFRFQQRLIDKQHGQLSQYETAAGQCVGELQKAQAQVWSLQAKIRESEARNQKLQSHLGEMELELHAAREEALQQERNVQNLSDNIVSKETELSGVESQQAQGEVLALQASLFQAQLELQAADRTQRQAGRNQDNLRRALERLESDLEGALQHRRETERHNQQQDPKQKPNSLLHTLRQRIKDRDRALERVVDEKFRCVEAEEQESRRLRLQLREKERDSLEVLLRGKALEVQQLGEACRSGRQQQRESSERQALGLRERDALISQMQSALHTRTQEAEELRSSLLGQLQVGPGQVVEALKARLRLKDRLFQDVLADRTRQAQEHQAHVQDLLNTVGARDQYIQDSAGRQAEVMSEQTGRLQELRRQLGARGQRSGSLSDGELATVREELTLALRRVMDAQEESDHQAIRMDSLTRTIRAKEEVIKEIQELRERLAQQDPGPLLRRDRQHDNNNRQPEFGELSLESEEEEDDDEDDANSAYTYSVDEEDSKLTAESLGNMKEGEEEEEEELDVTIEEQLGEELEEEEEEVDCEQWEAWDSELYLPRGAERSPAPALVAEDRAAR
ncbi:hypothetical protein CRUP_001554, partial [Coryphaenoides rupestris]